MDIFTKTNFDNRFDSIDSILDEEWAKSTFIIRDKDFSNAGTYSDWVKVNRYHSSADIKFTSTAPGMSIACNPKPQFTRYADIRSSGKLPERQSENMAVDTPGHKYGLGMGRYYSEAIDDNQQRIFLRFGVPNYTPILIWLAKSFDIDRVILQNRGEITSTFLQAVSAYTSAFAIIANPLIGLAMYAGKLFTSSNRYYQVRETMYTYWATVENILNSMFAKRSMLPYVFPEYTYKLDGYMNTELKLSKKAVQTINEIIPDVIDPETGRISVFAISLRAQAAYNRTVLRDVNANNESPIGTNKTGRVDSDRAIMSTFNTNSEGGSSFYAGFLLKNAAKVFRVGDGDTDSKTLTPFSMESVDETGDPIPVTESGPDQALADNIGKKKEQLTKYSEFLLAELTEGSAFAVFNVEATGSVSESFNSSVGSNPLETTFNSMSSAARNVINNASSIVNSIPVVGDAVKLVGDTAATFLSSASFGIANPALALAYGVNVTMPKVWESSSASLPKANYKIKLISPYGNVYSQMFNIYLPLAMILAGSLPRSTGASSYTSPFLCQLFDRGRVNSTMAIIDSVNITRGTSNLAFTRAGHANAIDVDLSITSLDEIIAVDVSSNGVLMKAMNAVSPSFNNTPFTDYINTITGVDVYTLIYNVPNLRLQLAERYMTLRSIGPNGDAAAYAAFSSNLFSPASDLAKLFLGNNAGVVQLTSVN